MINKQIYNKVLNITDHINYLYEFICLAEDYCPTSFNQLLDWLKLAASINKIELISDPFDNFMYCGKALDYEDEVAKDREKVVLSFTSFLYIWSAFEQLVPNFISKKRIRKLGKISAILDHLKNNFDNNKSIPALDELISLLENLTKETFFNKYFNKYKNMDLIEKSIRYSYIIRNNYVHGEFIFPEPKSHTEEEHFFEMIPYTCSTLILIIIQILFIIEYKDDPYDFIKLNESNDDYWKFEDFKYKNLRTLHMNEKNLKEYINQ